MLTYNERIELKEKFSKGEISLRVAQEQYWRDYKEGQRSWHTKDWKERRAKVLKKNCEICDSTDTLTIQHLSHPKKYNEYLREITRNYTNQYINSNSEIDKTEFGNHILSEYEYIPIPMCPSCHNKNPNVRLRKMPKYRCGECKHEFDKANYRAVTELISIFFQDEEGYEVRDKCFVSKDKWKNKHNLLNIKYWFQRNKAKNIDAESIERKAFLLYLNEDIKYLSFEDTITACKKCASNYDLHKMELCPKCKKNYKGIEYPTCIQCLPEEKRKTLEDQIEFGKQLREMEKRLGID